jgi:hypothetical protein
MLQAVETKARCERICLENKKVKAKVEEQLTS